MYKLSNRSLERLQGVHPVLVEIIKEAIETSPEDFGIPEYGGLRTQDEQRRLYAIGRTTEIGRKPITYTDGVRKKSNHQAKEDGYGWAFDVYIYDHETKKASWNVQRLERLALHLIAVAKKKGVILSWGGHWESFKDYPHFEMRSGQHLLV